MSKKEDLSAYLRKTAHFRRNILAAPMLVFGIGLFPEALASPEFLPLNVMFLIAAFLLILSAKLETKRDRKQLDGLLEELEKDGRLIPVLQDFDNAQSFLGKQGKLRLGEAWIFVKGANQLLRYQDIARVCSSSYEDSDYFTIEIKEVDGRIQCEYFAYPGSSDFEEIQKALQIISRRNPDTHIDWKSFPKSYW